MDVAVADRRETSDLQQEGEQKLRAALVGIEASAERLRHRELLTAHQLDELTRSLAHQARRLRLLLEGRAAAARTFDLNEALGPVVASAQASGMDVRCSVPRGIAVVGNGDRTAQVVAACSTTPGSTPQRHRSRFAPASCAARWRSTSRTAGAGTPAPCATSCWSATGAATACSGLGLDVARRIMEQQGGRSPCAPDPEADRRSCCTSGVFGVHLSDHRGERLSCGRSR